MIHLQYIQFFAGMRHRTVRVSVFTYFEPRRQSSICPKCHSKWRLPHSDAAGRLWSDFPIAPDLARHGSWRHDSLGNSRSTFNQSSHLLQLMHGSPSSFIQVLSLVDSRKDRCSSPQHGNGRCSCGPSKELRLLWSMAQSSWKGCSFLATTCVPERSSARLFSSLDAPAYE